MISAIHLQQPEGSSNFQAEAEAVLAVLARRPGFLRGQLARATDDENDWLLLTEWESVGAYRRGLGGYEVKMIATPLMAFAEDRPSAYEPLLSIDAHGATETAASDRAAPADRAAR